jgi:DNA-binding transcriptional LysR family regulator
MLHVTLRQLRVFEQVARHRSMSRAAEALHLTQPAVSMQVKQLETLVGMPLLEQVGRRLFLTEAGAELAEHARRIGIQVAEAESALNQLRGLERGQLRLAVVSTVNYVVPRLLASFSEKHPGVHISLQVANREAVLAALADNRTDLAITGQPPDDIDVVAQHFMDNPLVVIAPPGHALARQRHIPLARLRDEVLLVREAGSGTRAAMQRFFIERGIELRTGSELGTNEAIKQAVQAGLGLGVISAQTIELELETRRLVVLPVEGFPILRHWYIVHRTQKRLSAAAQAFRAHLLAHDPSAVPPARRPGRGRRANHASARR